MTAIARETFHHANGTVFAGDVFDNGDDIVSAYAVLFDVTEDEEGAETQAKPRPPRRGRSTGVS